jgi:hypothetical protein
MSQISITQNGTTTTITQNGMIAYKLPKSKYLLDVQGVGGLIVVTSISKAAAAVFTTAVPHMLQSGNFVDVLNAAGGDFTALNGNKYAVTVLTATTFSIAVNTSAYSGTYTASSASISNITNAEIRIGNVQSGWATTIVRKDVLVPTYTSLNDLVYQLELLLMESSSPAVSAVAVTPDTPYTEARALFIGSDGDVTATVNGVDLLFSNVIGGTILPVRSTEVIAATTSSTGIVALY